jgi:hypothetical protein
MLSDTKEKPFHCRYCGRRYARKFVEFAISLLHNHADELLLQSRDLVNRHEKSFHPHADGLNLSGGLCPSEDQNDVTMSEIRSLPTPPSQIFDTCSEKADFQSFSPSNVEHNMEYDITRSLDMTSPPLSDTMPADVATCRLGRDPPNTVGPHDTTVLSMLNTDRQVHDISPPRILDDLDLSLDTQYTSENSHYPIPPQNASGREAWNTANATYPMTGYDNWSPVTTTEGSHMALEPCVFPDEFDLIAIDSMALNHAALDADLSTYLSQPGLESFNQTQVLNTQEPGSLDAVPHESAPPPIEASALNVGLPGSKGSSLLLRMPSLLKETPRKTLPPPTLNENIYQSIMASVRLQTTMTTDMEPLLSLSEMQQFLKCYLVCFHRHCPIIHLPTLSLDSVPSHLILAICAIGALYRLRRKTAHDLWQCADQMCDKVCVR